MVSRVAAFGSTRGEYLLVESQMEIQCVESKGKEYYFISIPSAIIKQKTKQGTSTPRIIKGNYHHFSVFTLSKTGRVDYFVNHVPPKKGDKDAVMFYNIRKTVASLFQMKLIGPKKVRVEKAPEGVVRAHYRYQKTPQGLFKVIRNVRTKDLVKIRGIKRHKEIRFHQKTTATYKNGRFEKVEQRYVSVVGGKTEGNAEYDEFQVSSTVQNSKPDIDNNKRAKKLQRVASSLEIKFRKKHYKHKKKHQERTNTLSTITDIHHFATSINSEVETLEMSETSKNYAMYMHLEKVLKETNFPLLLNKLSENTKDLSTYNKALEYTKAVKEKALPELKVSCKKAGETKNLRFQKVLHTLLVATGTKEAENMILDHMSRPQLSQSAMTTVLSMKTASDDIIHALHAVSESKTSKVLAHQAYLLFAHAASKAENHSLVPYMVAHVVSKMTQSNDAKTFGYHIKALANAGEAVPLDILQKVIVSEHMPLDSRIDATHALQHRISDDAGETTEFIHSILNSDAHEEVKTAAIIAQTKRERETGAGDSILEFHKLSKNPETSHSVLHAITHYHEEADVGTLGFFDVVSKLTQKYVINPVVNTLPNPAKKWAKAVVSKVDETISAVDGALVKGTKFVYKGIKSAYKAVKKAFTGAYEKAKKLFKDLKEKYASAAKLSDVKKLCIRTSAKNEICAHNPQAMSFMGSVARRFDLKNFESSDNVVQEKVFGIRVLYLYFGIIGFTSSQQEAECSDTNLKFTAVHRIGMKIGIMSKRYDLITGDAYININTKYSGSKAVQDNFRLSIVGKVHLWDLPLVPDSMKNFAVCKKLLFNMIDQNFDFFSIQMNLMAGPIPIQFGFGVTGSFTLMYSFALCEESHVYSLSVEPEFSVGPTISAAIGVPILSGGIEGELTTGYSMPSVLAHTKCNRCSQISLQPNPLAFNLKVFIDILVHRIEHILYSKQIPIGSTVLAMKCMEEEDKDDFDPDEGVEESDITITNIALGNNLLFNLVSLKATQKKWIKLVHKLLSKLNKKMPKKKRIKKPSGSKGKGGRKGKGGKMGKAGKRGGNGKRKSRGGKRRKKQKRRRRRRKRKSKKKRKKSKKKKKKKKKCSAFKKKKIVHEFKKCVDGLVENKVNDFTPCKKTLYNQQLKCAVKPFKICLFKCLVRPGTNPSICRQACFSAPGGCVQMQKDKLKYCKENALRKMKGAPEILDDFKMYQRDYFQAQLTNNNANIRKFAAIIDFYKRTRIPKLKTWQYRISVSVCKSSFNLGLQFQCGWEVKCRYDCEGRHSQTYCDHQCGCRNLMLRKKFSACMRTSTPTPVCKLKKKEREVTCKRQTCFIRCRKTKSVDACNDSCKCEHQNIPYRRCLRNHHSLTRRFVNLHGGWKNNSQKYNSRYCIANKRKLAHPSSILNGIKKKLGLYKAIIAHFSTPRILYPKKLAYWKKEAKKIKPTKRDTYKFNNGIIDHERIRIYSRAAKESSKKVLRKYANLVHYFTYVHLGKYHKRVKYYRSKAIAYRKEAKKLANIIHYFTYRAKNPSRVKLYTPKMNYYNRYAARFEELNRHFFKIGRDKKRIRIYRDRLAYYTKSMNQSKHLLKLFSKRSKTIDVYKKFAKNYQKKLKAYNKYMGIVNYLGQKKIDKERLKLYGQKIREVIDSRSKLLACLQAPATEFCKNAHYSGECLTRVNDKICLRVQQNFDSCSKKCPNKQKEKNEMKQVVNFSKTLGDWNSNKKHFDVNYCSGKQPARFIPIIKHFKLKLSKYQSILKYWSSSRIDQSRLKVYKPKFNHYQIKSRQLYAILQNTKKPNIDHERIRIYSRAAKEASKKVRKYANLVHYFTYVHLGKYHKRVKYYRSKAIAYRKEAKKLANIIHYFTYRAKNPSRVKLYTPKMNYYNRYAARFEELNRHFFKIGRDKKRIRIYRDRLAYYKKSMNTAKYYLNYFKNHRFVDHKRVKYITKKLIHSQERERFFGSLVDRFSKPIIDKQRISQYTKIVQRIKVQIAKNSSCIQIQTISGGWKRNIDSYNIHYCKKSSRANMFQWLDAKRNKSKYLACVQATCHHVCEMKHPNPMFC
eukprot:gene3842-7002_t